MNLLIRKFQEDIIKITNESPLPIEVKKLVFHDVTRLVEQEADRIVNEELKKTSSDSKNTEEKG